MPIALADSGNNPFK